MCHFCLWGCQNFFRRKLWFLLIQKESYYFFNTTIFCINKSISSFVLNVISNITHYTSIVTYYFSIITYYNTLYYHYKLRACTLRILTRKFEIKLHRYSIMCRESGFRSYDYYDLIWPAIITYYDRLCHNTQLDNSLCCHIQRGIHS